VPKKTTNSESKPGSTQVQSGAIGGPSTARGVDYQLDYAVYHVLALLADQLRTPHQELTITIEPRALHEQGATRSDVRIASREISAELKLHPSRQDIVEWLSRVAQDPSMEKHELVYALASGTLMTSLSAAIRLAKEAGDDTEHLKLLAAHENIKDVDVILQPFGATAATRLHGLALKHLPEAVIQENINVRAQVLAPEHANKLVTALKAEFLEGMKVRKTYNCRLLIDQLQAQGIVFQAPKTFLLPDVSIHCRVVLAALQHCAGGLPNQVVAAVAECPTSQTDAILQPLIESRTLHFDGERWRLLFAMPGLIQAPGAAERALTSLLEFINKNEDTPAGRALVIDAVTLTRACFEETPKAIIYAFRKIEKLLKRIGNKYLVLELAELTIAAATQQPRSIDDARAQAHALICGCSWVNQRIDDLDAARSLAKKSLELGAEIGWDLNTAFCFKCVGRIMRMQAEKSSDHRTALLTESVQSINHAINKFNNVTEIGPTHPEIGDCYSLLARTYLVARQYEDARSALRSAYDLIPQNGSKDHLDLLILTGDLQAATSEYDAAENTYTQALELPEAADVQRSEIFARGFYQRGKLRESQGRSSQAIADYRRAGRLWLDLNEYEKGAQARWQELRLSSPQEKPILDEIANEESFLVRVTAYDLYRNRYPAPEAIGRRQQPSRQQITQLLKDARKEAAIQYPHR
jgi:tetratricopeptide (TPR) repeat protein